MADPAQILNDPDFISANPATKQAIFARHVENDPDYKSADDATKAAIRARFGFEPPAEETSVPEDFFRAAEQTGMPGPRKYAASEVPGAALSNVPKSGMKFIGDVYHAVRHPIETVAGLGELGLSAVEPFIPDAFLSMGTAPVAGVSPTAATQEARQQAQDTRSNFANFIAERYGGFDNLKRTMAEDPIGFLGDFSLLLSGGAGAARLAGKGQRAITGGGVIPAEQKIAGAFETGAKYTNPMTPLAYTAALPLKAGAKTTGYIYNMLAPKESTLIKAAEGRGQDIVNALRNYDQYVAEGQPTAGVVVAGQMPATKYAALQQELADVASTPYYTRQQANAAARKKALGGIAQDETALQAAENARQAATKPLYGKADKQIILADDTLNTLLERPSMEKALARAKQLASERNEQFQIGKNVPEQKVGSAIVDVNGAPLDVKTVPAEYAKFNGKSLHYLKLAMDDLIKDPKTFGLGTNEIAAIKNTRAEFLKWFEGKSESYGAARAAYTEASKPINIMQVGQYLEGKLLPALETSAGERAGVFAEAVRNAPGTLKGATGQPRFFKLSDVLTPEQVKIVQGISDDLAREAEFTKQARAGGKGKSFVAPPPAKIPDIMSRVVTLANALMSKLQGKINEKLAIEMATEMLSPELAAQAMEKALARQKKGEKLADPFVKTGRAAYATARGPLTLGGVQVTNALAAENQNNLRK